MFKIIQKFNDYTLLKGKKKQIGKENLVEHHDITGNGLRAVNVSSSSMHKLIDLR